MRVLLRVLVLLAHLPDLQTTVIELCDLHIPADTRAHVHAQGARLILSSNFGRNCVHFVRI